MQWLVLTGNNVFLSDHETVEWWSTLSDDLALRSWGEKIGDAARNERNGLRLFSLGAVLVSFGLIIGVIGNNAVAYVAGVLAMTLGVASTLFGFYVAVHFARLNNSLLEEASKTAET